MSIALSVHDRWRQTPVSGGPQILVCAYCVLLRWEHDDLSAPYWRWYWNDRSGAYLITGKRRIPIRPGQVVLIPPHTILGTGCRGKVGHLFMHFALGLERTLPAGRIFEHTASESETVMIRRLITAVDSQGGEGSLDVSFLAHALVNTALTTLPKDYWKTGLADVRITQALQSIAQGGRLTSNSELARSAGMHVNAFARKFVQATGYSPQQYRLRLRVEHSCTLLLDEKLTIDEISQATGFCDRFHFSRVFKRLMNVTPSVFRRGSSLVDLSVLDQAAAKPALSPRRKKTII